MLPCRVIDPYFLAYSSVASGLFLAKNTENKPETSQKQARNKPECSQEQAARDLNKNSPEKAISSTLPL
jgi:hypothetical protein